MLYEIALYRWTAGLFADFLFCEGYGFSYRSGKHRGGTSDGGLSPPQMDSYSITGDSQLSPILSTPIYLQT